MRSGELINVAGNPFNVLTWVDVCLPKQAGRWTGAHLPDPCTVLRPPAISRFFWKAAQLKEALTRVASGTGRRQFGYLSATQMCVAFQRTHIERQRL